MHFIHSNPIDRYAINERTDFKLNDDGSLDIILSYYKPNDISNWLPGSEDEFHFYMRLYLPKMDEFLKRTAPTIVPFEK